MQEELSNYKALLENIGWLKLMSIAEEQVTNRLPTILAKTENLLEVTGSEFEKGEVSGINLFIQLPGIAIESLEADIKYAQEQIEHVTGERTTRDDDDRDASDDGRVDGSAPRV